MEEELKKFIIEHDLIKKTHEYFWPVFYRWKEEKTGIFGKKIKNIKDEDVMLWDHSVWLKLSPWTECDDNYVEIVLKASCRQSETHPICTYFALFSLEDGEFSYDEIDDL